jgi:hypothetical protein
MGNGKKIKVTVQTSVSEGGTVSAVEGETAQKLETGLGEALGSLAAPVAPLLAEIIEQSSEEASTAWLTGRNCFLLASYDLDGTDVGEAYNKLLDAPGKGYTGYIITWTGDFNPGLIKDRILNYYEQMGVKPEDIKKCNRIGIMVHGHAAGAAVAKRILGGPVYADEIFDAAEPFIEPGGELWLFVCGGEQENWDDAVAASKRPLKVIVWPGGGAGCVFERDMDPFIGPLVGR